MSQPISVRRRLQDGNKAARRRQWPAAIAAYRDVLGAQPDHAWAHNNIGYCLKQLRRFDEAISHLQRAISLNPTNALAVANLAVALRDRGDAGGAIPWWRRLTELRPEVASHWIDLGLDLMRIGRVRESRHCCERALAIDPGNRIAIANLLLGLNYDEGLSVEQVWQEHQRLASQLARPRRSPDSFPQARSRDSNRRLRIGYLSSDFYRHPVGKLISPIIAGHDAGRFEIHAYHNGNMRDDLTETIAGHCHAFRLIAEETDAELERRILGDRIDILVELDGYVSGGKRLALLAGGVAPVQISFLGYPNTTGLTAIDYRLTDRFVDPPGQTEHLHSETLLRLDRGFLCHQLADDVPPPNDPPCRERGSVTFGSFNNPSKVSVSALRAWARILRAVPGSRLIVNFRRDFAFPAPRERWRDWIASEGVDPDRLDFRGGRSSPGDHLRMIAQADLCLDPFPYQGTMTTLDALSVGVPVLTLAGQTYCRRASSALLLRLGFEELVTESIDEYVARAVELAGRPERLAELRSALRDRFLKSEISDVAGFVGELERVYLNVWRDWPRTT